MVSGGPWLRLSREGATVVVNGRRQADCEAAAAGIAGSLAVGGDMSEQSDIDSLVERVRSELGRIDILVNNAAIFASQRGHPGHR